MIIFKISKTASISCIFLCVCILPWSANAEDMYSWRDNSGHTFFGSNPPRNAIDQRKIRSHVISRYSSEKVVTGFRVKGKKDETSSRASLSNKHGKGSESIKSEPKIKGNPAHLTYQPPEVSLNDRGEISSCIVSVRNEGKSSASDVVVQLTFPDGTFITAIGPESVKAGEVASFGLPSNSVPLRVSVRGSQELNPEALKPEVMVSYN